MNSANSSLGTGPSEGAALMAGRTHTRALSPRPSGPAPTHWGGKVRDVTFSLACVALGYLTGWCDELSESLRVQFLVPAGCQWALCAQCWWVQSTFRDGHGSRGHCCAPSQSSGCNGG